MKDYADTMVSGCSYDFIGFWKLNKKEYVELYLIYESVR